MNPDHFCDFDFSFYGSQVKSYIFTFDLWATIQKNKNIPLSLSPTSYQMLEC